MGPSTLGASVVACAKQLVPPTYTLKLAPETGCTTPAPADEPEYATMQPRMRPLGTQITGLGFGFVDTDEVIPAWLNSVEREAQILDDEGNLVSCSPITVELDWILPEGTLAAHVTRPATWLGTLIAAAYLLL